jgi:hypothetical protein
MTITDFFYGNYKLIPNLEAFEALGALKDSQRLTGNGGGVKTEHNCNQIELGDSIKILRTSFVF